MIKRQWDGYINDDPVKRTQKCLPINIFQKLWRSNNTELSKAIGQLATGALFFGMRSCEYSEVTGNRKTKLLQLKNIRFFQGRQEIAKSKNMNLNNITCVTIIFMKQKNKHKEADITMHKSNSELCPVMAWGSIVKRILHYNNINLDTPVNYVELHNKPRHVTSTDVLNLIRLYVAIEGKDKLGFSPEDVGTHSIRSSFAMFLHLQKVDRDRIMLQGRWRSSAFLDYIRPQVEAFSAGLSSIMTSCMIFFTMPENTKSTYIFQPGHAHVIYDDEAPVTPTTHGPRSDQALHLTPRPKMTAHLFWL